MSCSVLPVCTNYVVHRKEMRTVHMRRRGGPPAGHGRVRPRSRPLPQCCHQPLVGKLVSGRLPLRRLRLRGAPCGVVFFLEGRIRTDRPDGQTIRPVEWSSLVVVEVLDWVVKVGGESVSSMTALWMIRMSLFLDTQKRTTRCPRASG